MPGIRTGAFASTRPTGPTTVVWDVGVMDAVRQQPDGSTAAGATGDLVHSVRSVADMHTLVVLVANGEMAVLQVASDNGKRAVRMPTGASRTRMNIEPPFLGATQTLAGTTWAVVYRTPTLQTGYVSGVSPFAKLLVVNGMVALYRNAFDNAMVLYDGSTSRELPLTVDSPVLSTSRMVLCLRFDAGGTLHWCHSANPARTVHTMAVSAGVTACPVRSVNWFGNPDQDGYHAEWNELRVSTQAFSDAELQGLCNDLAAKWPAVEPTY